MPEVSGRKQRLLFAKAEFLLSKLPLLTVRAPFFLDLARSVDRDISSSEIALWKLFWTGRTLSKVDW
ncbi:MAG: hypothetical protein ABIO43_04145 [Sphingomicrobium sp.]